MKKKNVTKYDLWLAKLANGRELFSELSDDEVYQIIFKVSEISFNRNSILSEFFTFEDIADEIYRNYLIRDKEKDLSVLSDIQTKDFPYYDEKSGKYFKAWRPRTECKGFNRMRERGMTIVHFSNLIYREMRNMVAGYTRNRKYQEMQKALSIDFENEDLPMIEMIEDTKQTFQAENFISNDSIKSIYYNIDDVEENDDFMICMDNERRILSYGNLLLLYNYLDTGKRVTSREILKHIIYKGSNILSEENKRYLENFITSFKRFLTSNNMIAMKKEQIEKEKEYGFIQ